MANRIDPLNLRGYTKKEMARKLMQALEAEKKRQEIREHRFLYPETASYTFDQLLEKAAGGGDKADENEDYILDIGNH